MTFDDGIVKFYEKINIAEKGELPNIVLRFRSIYKFSYSVLGINRFYEAKKNQDQLEEVIDIYRDRSIKTNFIAVLENGIQYQVFMVQHTVDDDGINITKVSLGHINEEFNIQN